MKKLYCIFVIILAMCVVGDYVLLQKIKKLREMYADNYHLIRVLAAEHVDCCIYEIKRNPRLQEK